MKLFDLFSQELNDKRDEELTLEEYFDRCKSEPITYATPAERMIAAIGEPERIDTTQDPRLARIFQRTI